MIAYEKVPQTVGIVQSVNEKVIAAFPTVYDWAAGTFDVMALVMHGLVRVS